MHTDASCISSPALSVQLMSLVMSDFAVPVSCTANRLHADANQLQLIHDPDMLPAARPPPPPLPAMISRLHVFLHQPGLLCQKPLPSNPRTAPNSIATQQGLHNLVLT
jgi:hypothetical protein